MVQYYDKFIVLSTTSSVKVTNSFKVTVKIKLFSTKSLLFSIKFYIFLFLQRVNKFRERGIFYYVIV